MPQVPSTSQEASSGPPPGSSQSCTGPLLVQSLEEASQNSPGIKYHFFLPTLSQDLIHYYK